MLDQATNYIVLLRKNVEELKQRKELMIKGRDESSRTTTKDDERNSSMLPVFTIRDMVSILEVNLITGLNTNNNNNFMLGKVFSVLKEEGAEVVKASYSKVGDKIFCTIHSKFIKKGMASVQSLIGLGHAVGLVGAHHGSLLDEFYTLNGSDYQNGTRDGPLRAQQHGPVRLRTGQKPFP
ncbi:hypothetical protein ACSBR1_006697 [Camellia fascicularis]